MNRLRSQFWAPASNYYVLAVAVAVGFFFVAWGLLDDADVHSPWQTAGVGASVVLIGAVILRGLLLRRSQSSFIRQPPPTAADRHKLTVERVSAILAEIRRKSDAANVLERISSGHREVAEVCSAFMLRVDGELPTVQPDSPRLASLLRGRNKAAEIHRYHTLKWAEIESRAWSSDATMLAEPVARLQAAANAVAVVDEALTAYPDERNLRDSRSLLAELAVSIEVANAVEAAESAALRGDHEAARRMYREALLSLGRDNVHSPERENAAARIREALERLPFV